MRRNLPSRTRNRLKGDAQHDRPALVSDRSRRGPIPNIRKAALITAVQLHPLPPEADGHSRPGHRPDLRPLDAVIRIGALRRLGPFDVDRAVHPNAKRGTCDRAHRQERGNGHAYRCQNRELQVVEIGGRRVILSVRSPSLEGSALLNVPELGTDGQGARHFHRRKPADGDPCGAVHIAETGPATSHRGHAGRCAPANRLPVRRSGRCE